MKKVHVASVVAAVAIALYGGAWVVLPHPEIPRSLAFDEASWRQGQTAVTNQNAPRLPSADGLLASGILNGKPKEEVLNILGPVTDTNKFADHGLVYWLGPERGFISIDSEWLVIDFDSSGRVSKATLVQD